MTSDITRKACASFTLKFDKISSPIDGFKYDIDGIAAYFLNHHVYCTAFPKLLYSPLFATNGSNNKKQRRTQWRHQQ